jgi:hypothetical protein
MNINRQYRHNTSFVRVHFRLENKLETSYSTLLNSHTKASLSPMKIEALCVTSSLTVIVLDNPKSSPIFKSILSPKLV